MKTIPAATTARTLSALIPACDKIGRTMNRRNKSRWLRSLIVLCSLVNILSAATFGKFTYSDNGTYITITDYPTTEVGQVEIPASIIGKPVTNIGDRAFYACSGLTSVTIPSSVTTIAISAFERCSGLTNVVIPSSVTNIAPYVFVDCTGLTSVTIPSSVTSLGSQVFQGCIGLTSVAIPSSLTYTGSGTFNNCWSLTDVKIPTSVTSIGTSAFENCWRLKRVTIPSGVTSIGNAAFSNCSGLVDVPISAGVVSIGDSAFEYCTGLGRVTIPASVTSVSNHAFFFCGKLTQVLFLGNAPALGANAFMGTNSGLTVYHLNGKAGFTSPTWNGYPVVNLGDLSPQGVWAFSNGFPATTDLRTDPDGDGVNLLIAYALNLDPNQDLSGSLPMPFRFSASKLGITYYAGNSDVTYAVETSTDLQNWSTGGVILSTPDAYSRRTASINMTAPCRYMRLVVSVP